MKKITINLSTKRNGRDVKAYFTIFFVLLAAILSFYNLRGFLENHSYMKKMGERVAALEKGLPAGHGATSANDEDLSGLRKDIEFVNGFIAKKRLSWTVLLTSLEKSLPEDVYLLQIRPEFNGGRVDIAGISGGVDKALETVQTMSKGGFSDVFLKRHSREKDGSRVLFEISAVHRYGK